MIDVTSIGPLPDSMTAIDLAQLAAPLQQRPDRFQAYYGDDVDEIAAEIEEIPDWRSMVTVMLADDQLVAWVAAEVDDEVGRTWWWGPVVEPALDWTGTARGLLEVAEGRLDGRVDQFEFAVDARHVDAIALAEELGHRRDTGSLLLRLDDALGVTTSVEAAAQLQIEPPAPPWHTRLAALHERVFPDSHRTGEQIAANAEGDVVLIATDRHTGALAGYVRAEIQPGGEGYLDFLGVDEQVRSRGFGRHLVAAAVAELVERGVTSVSLTVREDNAPARSLYTHLGFTGDRILAPLRRGFGDQ